MAENAPETLATPRLGAEPGHGGDSKPARRPHTYSRLTTAIAVLALAFAAYSVWRLDAMRDRLEEIQTTARAQESERALLRAELRSLEQREQHARAELERGLRDLSEVPRQVQELANTTEELRGRAQGPERAWSRAEAMYLLELAQRRLALNQDVETAIVALEAADARLAALRDSNFSGVRARIARDLTALRAVRLPDTTGLTTRLASLEERAASLPVKGILISERTTASNEDLPTGWFARAWALLRQSMGSLVRVREVDSRAGGIVTKEEALLRRAHLQLLLFSARNAVTRLDAQAFTQALSAARVWMREYFDLQDPAVQAALKEVQALEPVQIRPALPDISSSSAALRRLMPQYTSGPE
jgi:uroporphyrin-3 C-methyltransferase